jgi:hypothetical protein
MALYASIADATQAIVQIDMPVVQAGAGSGSGTVKSLDWMDDELRVLIHAEAAAGGGDATGQIGLLDKHKAHSSADSGAWVSSWMEFTVDDPEGRPEVKTILDFNAIASAGTPAPGLASLTSSATVIVTIGPSDGTGVQLRVDNDTLL